MNVHASAPGKLVLLGEYAVLDGAPAMVAAIDRYVSVDLVAADKKHGISVDITHLKAGPLPVDPQTLALFSVTHPGNEADQRRAIMGMLESTGLMLHARQRFGHAFILTIDASPFFSDDGVKFGFGSSAAITVAIEGLAAHLRDGTPTHSNRLAGHAIRIHRSMQLELGSGIDVAASAVGGILKFQLLRASDSSAPDLKRLAPLNDVHVNAVWTGKCASTAALLTGMAGFKARQPNAYRHVMQQLADVCRRGIAAYQEGQPDRFLTAVDDYSRGLVELSMLSDLPIFSPIHQRLARIARARGGIYKPSGAGGGDVGLAFSVDPRKHDRIAADFNRAGFLVFDLKWGVNGFSLKERKHG